MGLMAREGIPYVVVPGFVALAGFLTGYTAVGGAAAAAAAAAGLFFRDPERHNAARPGEVLSPADGRVVAVDTGREDRYLKEEALRISVFMTVFNVHVNRVPMDGTVVSVRHVPGGFAMAHLDDAGIVNERTEILLEDGRGERVLMVQVAGLVARRIVCRLREGDTVQRGRRFGLIHFGSRLDLYLPLSVRPVVTVGDRVRAGVSVLAQRQ